MVTASPVRIDRGRVAELTEREQKKLDARTTRSGEMYKRARRSLSGGVASSYQIRDPWPIYLERGHGSKVWDVDGTEMVDFHNGFGSMVQGHANPAIVEAVQRQVARGTHFAAPVEDAIVVSEELVRRFGLPQWRYVNSGSEATMDAIRIARAFTGRDTIVKIFGSYHGHHDYVMVSISVPYENIGDPDNYASLPYGAGIPKAASDLTIAVPFNDAGAMERRIERLFEEGRPPACVIMEPAVMNLGGVLPDMVTMAKALGGGLPSGAIGGSEEVMEVVNNGQVYQVGTYNGNPLTMAAARASLEKVLTPEAYAHLDMLNDRLMAGCDAVLDKYNLPGYTVGISSKGCVTFSPTKITDYASFQANHDGELTDLAWLYMMNRGVFMTPGREEEWTLSIAHSVEDADTYIAAFEELAHDLVA